jgi:AcrR family transcriptional regulator
MAETGRQTRPYRSSLRRAQAAQTQERILDAAETLFAERSYAATSIDAIARAAGVSGPTVYATFGTKQELLRRLVRRAVRGGDGPLLDQPRALAVRDQPDQARQIVLFCADIAERLDRAGPLMAVVAAAAAGDEGLAQLERELQAARHGAIGEFVGWLEANGPLRMPRSAAADTVWTIASPQTHGLLRGARGWSRRRYAAWLAETLTAVLLPPR